jgi:hypothetical protein
METKDMAQRVAAFHMVAGSEEYMKYFRGKLKKYKVNSPAELDDAQKKKFFNEVDKGWKAEDE